MTSGSTVGAVEDHWTVGRVAELADVSVRTLHHYDEVGLVRPSARTAAGYRAYSAGDVERLREVLAYRRLGFGLREVAELVGDSSTDAIAHLRRLRGLVLERRDRADAMVAAIDRELEARAKGLKETPETTGDARRTVVRRDRRRLHHDTAYRASHRRADLGRSRGRADGTERRCRHRRLRARRPRRDRGGAIGCHAGTAACRLGAVRGRRRWENLPFEDHLDAAMAVSTVHHWGTR